VKERLRGKAIALAALLFIALVTGGPAAASTVSGAPAVAAGAGSNVVSWGVNVHPEDADWTLEGAGRAFDHARKLGCRFVRTDFYWSELEPARDAWDEGRAAWFGAYLDAAAAKGLYVQVILTGAPGWARDLYGASPDAFFEEFEEYCAEVARRYGTRVHYYQIWNEADNFLDFVSLPDDWRLFAGGRAGLESRDADFETYANLTSLPWSEWALDDWMRRAPGAIDIVGVDYYPGTWAMTPYEDWTPLRRVLDKTTDPDDPAYGKKVAVQETGFSTWLCFWHNEKDQRNWINASLPALRTIVSVHNARFPNKVVSCTWYELRDMDTSGGWWLEYHFGILRSDWSKKPGFGDLRARIAEFVPR